MPIDWLTLGAALLAGLMGGAHCAVMCGGIATSFSAMAPGRGWRAALEANLGRVGGYVLAGAVAGGLGHGILRLARLEWLAWGLRAAVGAILVMVALRLLDRRTGSGPLSRPATRLWARLRPLQRRLIPADTGAKRIGLGMLWGWMPCGLSTTLLAAAWLQADVRNAAMTMAAFGLGTLPLMVPLTWSGARMGRRLQQARWRAPAGLLVLAAGLLTLAAPWLVQEPALHGLLQALGCLPRPTA